VIIAAAAFRRVGDRRWNGRTIKAPSYTSALSFSSAIARIVDLTPDVLGERRRGGFG
jgi:hypothetical protein